MDREVEKLLEQFPERPKSELDELFEALEDEPDKEEQIDRLVFALSNGDILKAKKIYETITLREALEWLLITHKTQQG